VSEICRRDGIPLAIELAATRIRTMTAAEIRRRLHECFRLLTRGLRDCPKAAPHAACRAAWSYDLLPAAERMAGARGSALRLREDFRL